METIAVWPDGTWAYTNEIEMYLSWMSDDFELIEVEFDDEGEPLLPSRFASCNWT